MTHFTSVMSCISESNNIINKQNVGPTLLIRNGIDCEYWSLYGLWLEGRGKKIKGPGDVNPKKQVVLVDI